MARTSTRHGLSLQSSDSDSVEAASFPPALLFEASCSSETSRFLQLRGDAYKIIFLFKFFIYYNKYVNIQACSHSSVLCCDYVLSFRL
jgi:hypothetical protein